MRFVQFVSQMSHHSFHQAFHASHVAHGVVVLVSGALVWFAIYTEHFFIAIALPFLVFLAIFCASMPWHAYCIYREEYDRRVAVESMLETAREHSVSVKAEQLPEARRQLDRLTQPGKALFSLLLRCGELTDAQITRQFQLDGVTDIPDAGNLSELTTFLRKSNEGAWSIKTEWEGPLREILSGA